MKFSTEIPPVYTKCYKMSGVPWHRGLIITYGDTVHCAYKITPDLEVHEATHIKQQAEIGRDEWWDKYFADVEFRLSQEVEAYRNQLEWAKENTSRQVFRSLRRQVIKDMSRVYGGMCTREEAEKLV